MSPKVKFKYPSVGVGIFLANPNDETILVGKRKDSSLIGLPGGWLEKGEEWEDCAKRELAEETGLEKETTKFNHIYTLNCRFFNKSKNYHNISCIMYSEIDEKDLLIIKNTEPDKCIGWYWTTINELRNNSEGLFYPLRDFLSKFKTIVSTSNLKMMIKNYCF